MKERVSFDKKLAMLEKHIYSDAEPELWHSNIRAYLIGARTDVKSSLDWVEAQGNKKISCDYLKGSSRAMMIDFDPAQCSHELWSWLSPTLGKSAHANRTFHNVDKLNGAEVYRRLTVPTTSTSVLRRNALRDSV